MKRYDLIEAVSFGLGRGSSVINRWRGAISLCMLIGAYSLFSSADTFGQTKKIGMLPKFTSDPYFVAVNQGAQEAAKELNVIVEFNGPVDANVAAQADIIDKWIRSGMNAITVSANDPNALAPA